MQWYILKNSTEKSTVGDYPQTDGMKKGYDLRKPNSVWNLPNRKFPEFEPDFDSFVLDKKAKLTDFISTSLISASGFIINDKGKSILDQFSLPIHKYFPIKLIHKNKLNENYFWMHFGEDSTSVIEFSKPRFELKDPLHPEQSEELPIMNENDLINTRKKYKRRIFAAINY